MNRFADILISHAYSRKQESFTYTIPDGLELSPGDGVVVSFQTGEKAGLVMKIHDAEPSFKTKPILRKLFEEPLLHEWQMKIADWISEYYFCSKYDSIRLFLPTGIFKIIKRQVKAANNKITQEPTALRTLSPDQAEILRKITADHPPISLIYGVTGAGKTEIYTQLIKNCIQNGGQALILAPEISLTPQLLRTFETEFPRIAVIHSRVGEAEKARLWRAIQKGEIDVILGSRSALFCPFQNLKLLVMDEEHEWSYKQDQSPRYHARDVALKIAEFTGAQVVFGSATPSIETMWHAKKGDYAFFEMKERISGTPLPRVEIVDMRDELKGGNFSLFSEKLEQKIRSTLDAKEQVILFLNRRGSASSTVCRDCGYTSKCPDCELPLTYHARNFHQALLICHHCGHVEGVPTVCPTCHSTRIRHLGLGTEKVELEIKKLFPLARVARADKDTMGKKDSFTELHKQLNAGEIDILIGTQMIGKGFDIAKVNLVGILMADLGLNIPDFRTTERMFELLTQVAGRAGRRKKQGEVVLQTYNPDHHAVRFSQTHNYDGFYEQEISSREEGHFPPFAKIIKLMVVDKNADQAQKKAETLKAKLLVDSADHHIFAAPALLSKIRGSYQWNVLIQGQNPREVLSKLPPELLKDLRIDVDPMVSI